MYLEALTSLADKADILVVDESVNNLNLFTGVDGELPKLQGGK